jgi:class 3 adenylate cyclase/pimeloyl-ACP methyl ester carboxylesterase
MQVPEVRYARAGDLRLAYQQWGDGPPLIIVPDLISNVEITWEHELYRRSLEHLGKYMTCVYFDKRGIGASDRFEEAPTLEQRNQDILAVMDTVGWERAHVMGQSEGAAMGQLFAVDFPERVESLTLVNTFVPPRYIGRIPEYIRDGDPPILNGVQIYEHFERVLETWGEDASYLVEWAMPSQIGNEAFTRWLARLLRCAASPKDFKRQLDSIIRLDAGDAPERISARTLVMHVQGDQELHVSMGRLLADIIPDAEYVEVEGADHFFWIMPNWREMVDRVIRFATGANAQSTTTRQFGTVLFTDIVDSTRRSASVGDATWRDGLDSHDRTARGLIDQHRGRVVKSTGDGLLAVFDSPSQGVECGIKMCNALRGIGVEIRAGLHAGEIEVHDDGDISGIAVNLAARVEQNAADGELWASSTVRDLMLGGSASFTERGEHQLKGIDGAWRLFSVGAS